MQLLQMFFKKLKSKGKYISAHVFFFLKMDHVIVDCVTCLEVLSSLVVVTCILWLVYKLVIVEMCILTWWSWTFLELL